MPDFMLEPDEIEPERPERRRPVRLVSTGLADTAEAPPSARRGQEHPPCYVLCRTCNSPVLLGQTPSGVQVALNVSGRRCYTVHWLTGAHQPRLAESRAYPEHQCRQGKGDA
jgi:hypothetical protein